MSAILKPEAPAKDRGYTLPTANWPSTSALRVARRAPSRRAQSFGGASGFNGREMTAVIRDAADTSKTLQLQKAKAKDCALCLSLALQPSINYRWTSQLSRNRALEAALVRAPDVTSSHSPDTPGCLQGQRTRRFRANDYDSLGNEFVTQSRNRNPPSTGNTTPVM
jgi:hypothetical protein